MSQSQWSGGALTGYGNSRGLGGQCKTQLAAERPLCTHAWIIFFGPKLGPYQHSRALQRSILEHISICLPSQFVHLHGKPYRLFFERELDGTAPISVRSVRLHNSFTCMGNRIDYFSSWRSMELGRFRYEGSPPSVSLTAERPIRLHGTHNDYFFGPELERNRTRETSVTLFFYIYRRA